MPKRAAVSVRDVLRKKRIKYTTKDEDFLRAQEFRLVVDTRNAIRMQRYRTHKLAVDAATHGMTCQIAKTIFVCGPHRAPERPSHGEDDEAHYAPRLGAHHTWDRWSQSTKNMRTKFFLLAFKVAFHVKDVFDGMTKREMDLHTAACKVLAVFDTISSGIVSMKRGACIEDLITKSLEFPGVFQRYLTAFKDWKRFDEVKLTGRITHDLNAVYEATGLLLDTDSDTPELRTQFHSRIQDLRMKLLHIAGEPAMRRVDALHNAALLALPVKEKTDTTHPLCIITMGGHSALTHYTTNEQLAHELQLDSTFTPDEHGPSHLHTKLRRCFQVPHPRVQLFHLRNS